MFESGLAVGYSQRYIRSDDGSSRLPVHVIRFILTSLLALLELPYLKGYNLCDIHWRLKPSRELTKAASTAFTSTSPNAHPSRHVDAQLIPATLSTMDVMMAAENGNANWPQLIAIAFGGRGIYVRWLRIALTASGTEEQLWTR